MLIRFIAVMSFLLTQLVQLYFAGFLHNWTSKGVDAGNGSGMGSGLVLNVVLLLAFGLVHSALARPAIKQALYGALNDKLSRAVYNLVATAQLALLMLCWTPLPATLWQVENGVGAGVVYALFGLGMGLLFWAIFAIDAWHFFGLRQAFGDVRSAPQFVVRGPYRLVRHPIQSGLILALWATPTMTAGHALLAGALTFYSLLATLMLEERDLRAQLGQDYEAYRRRVPALLPGLPGRRD